MPTAPSFDRFSRLVAALAWGQDDAVRRVLADCRSDWPALHALAVRHRLAGWLHLSLEAAGGLPSVPEEVANALKQTRLRQWLKNERLLDETARLRDAFAAAGVGALFFKGPLFAERVYGRLEARAVSDIDVLVGAAGEIDAVPDVLGAAAEVLGSAGYRRVSRDLGPRRLTLRFAHHDEYWSADIPLELHWALQRHPGQRLDTGGLWSRRIEVPLGDRSCPMLGDEDSLVALILSVPADLAIGKLTLRTFLDIALLLQRLPVGDGHWRAFFTRRAEEGAERMSVAVLAAVVEVFTVAEVATLAELFDARAGDWAPATADSRPDSAATLAAVPAGCDGAALAPALVAALAGALDAAPLARRRLAWSLYEVPAALSAAWWAISLPVRLAAYPTESARRWPRLR